MIAIHIFAILQFPIVEGTRHCVVHHLAGTSAQDALDRLRPHERELLEGESFINTDAYIDDLGGRSAVFSASRSSPCPGVTDDEFGRWKAVSLQGRWESGQWHAPAFRPVTFSA